MNLIDEKNESAYGAEVMCASWNPTIDAIAEYIKDSDFSETDNQLEPMDEAAFLNRIYIYQE